MDMKRDAVTGHGHGQRTWSWPQLGMGRDIDMDMFMNPGRGYRYFFKDQKNSGGIPQHTILGRPYSPQYRTTASQNYLLLLIAERGNFSYLISKIVTSYIVHSGEFIIKSFAYCKKSPLSLV